MIKLVTYSQLAFHSPPPKKKLPTFLMFFFSWDLPNFTHCETPLPIWIPITPNITPKSRFVKIHHDLHVQP